MKASIYNSGKWRMLLPSTIKAGRLGSGNLRTAKDEFPATITDIISTEAGEHENQLWKTSEDVVSNGIEFESVEDYRHWSPRSQLYASTDALLQYLRNGWELKDRVLVEMCRCESWRYVELYYFVLSLNDERITMPVIANPVVVRLVQERGLAVVHVVTRSKNHSRVRHIASDSVRSDR